MAWTVKYLKSTSRWGLIDAGLKTPVTTPVLYTEDQMTVDRAAIFAAAVAAGAAVPLPVKSDSRFTYDSANVRMLYQGQPYFDAALMAGLYTIIQSPATETSTLVGGIINSRVLSNMFGYGSSSGGEFVPVAVAPWVEVQAHGSQQDYTHIIVYAYRTTNNDRACGAILTNASGRSSGYSSWYLKTEPVQPTDVAEFYGDLIDTPPQPIYTDDPYTGAGYPASTAGGGASGGSFDFTEDGITGVHTPGLDLLNTGLITAWRPSKAILAQLAGWLWVTTPGQIVQQLFGNPINAIIGLNIVPVSPPVDGGTNTIKFGVDDSGVACPKIASQHVTVDCGTLTIDPKYGSYMDFAPQTSAELFLPYVGGLTLDVNDVIGKTIGVKYQVDVLSGACVAYVFIDGVLHYQKAGGCAATAPITGSQMPNVVSGVLSIAGSVAGFVASAGASGASTAAKVASGIAAGTSVAESAANMLKQSVSYSGTISGWAGLLGAQKPYLILSLPHAAIPGGQNTLMGYPAWVSGRVGDFTGYTECTVDRVTATRATDKEVEEIKSLLEGGVIL